MYYEKGANYADELGLPAILEMYSEEIDRLLQLDYATAYFTVSRYKRQTEVSQSDFNVLMRYLRERIISK